ncbi:MAG: RNA recognition motif domain-containing protein [Bacteriovoracia bacterium]
MGKKLYVGNLPYSATDDSLAQHFSQAGQVESAKVIMDRDSGRSKGFGFVEMGSDSDATKAIETLNGQMLDGRALNVSEARPQAPREGGGRGFGGGGGGGYGGGGGGGYGGGGGGGGRGGRGGGGGGGRDRW